MNRPCSSAGVVDRPLAALEDAGSLFGPSCRVVTFDGRGNGRSDRPAPELGDDEFAADALAVMDATGTSSR